MPRRDVLLMMMAPAGTAVHTPVQVQKLAFLIDRLIGETIGGTGFHFKPWHYGPFDKAVYKALEELERDGLVEINDMSAQMQPTQYRLTNLGEREGTDLLETLGDQNPDTAEYIETLSNWVRDQSFASLLRAIYAKFPDMAANSVFKDSLASVQ